MRSRYSAFALLDAPYLLATWHPSTRPASLELDPDQRWSGLRVVSASTGGGVFAPEGTVEFVATYHSPEGPAQVHEVSRFVQDAGRWVYLGPVGEG